jgi:hypothetical protein
MSDLTQRVFTLNSCLSRFLTIGPLVSLANIIGHLLSYSLLHRIGLNEWGGCTRTVAKSLLLCVVIKSQPSVAMGIPVEHRGFHQDFFSMAWQPPSGTGPPHYRSFTITLRNTTLGRTPLKEWSASRRNLYMTTRNTHMRQTSPAEFETTIPARERPQTHALDPAANGIGRFCRMRLLNTEPTRNVFVNTDGSFMMSPLQIRKQFTNSWEGFDQRVPFRTGREHT